MRSFSAHAGIMGVPSKKRVYKITPYSSLSSQKPPPDSAMIALVVYILQNIAYLCFCTMVTHV